MKCSRDFTDSGLTGAVDSRSKKSILSCSINCQTAAFIDPMASMFPGGTEILLSLTELEAQTMTGHSHSVVDLVICILSSTRAKSHGELNFGTVG